MGVGYDYECALLIFDFTVRDAMRQFRKHELYGEIVEEFVDARVVLLDDQEWNMQQATSDQPHIIEEPISCKRCELWGNKLNDAGICEDCENRRSDE